MAGNSSGYPSVWSIISGNIGNTIEVAINQTLVHFSGYNLDLNSFKNSIIHLLQLPMTKIPAGHFRGQGNQTVNADINSTVYQAVYGAMSELNVSISSNLSLLSFDHSLAKRLTNDIEMEVFNEILLNSTDARSNESFTDFFHNLPLKDETLFVALVCMAIIVPIIFITLFFIFFYKKRQENKERSHEMLLREQPENAVEEFKGERQTGDEPPDLNLKVAPA